MNLFELVAVLITLAAVLAYINRRFIRLPGAIGLMVLALLLSLVVLLVGQVVPGVVPAAEEMLAAIDFDETLLHGMLGYLLFAGALHVNLDDLRQQKMIVATLATVGVLVSTAVVGGMIWLVAQGLGLGLPPIYCLAFGALIAPTDPIAVLALLKQMGAPKTLETKITGESLFNDGVGVVVFLAIVAVIAGTGAGHGGAEPVDAAHAAHAAASAAGDAAHNEEVGVRSVLTLFLMEAVGGVVFGLTLGLVAYGMLKSLDEYATEVLISLALVTGGYALAYRLHVSGPIAMVVAGLLIGNHGRTLAMSATTREHLDTFWELIDETLNAVLFVLIGLELLVLELTGRYLLAGLVAIPVVLGARLLAVSLPVLALRRLREFSPHVIKVLTWGGLRGGISVALALSLRDVVTDNGGHRPATELILVMTYVVVVFSIVVQGLTLAPLLRRLGLSGR